MSGREREVLMTVTPERDVPTRYAQASGDHNPIHTDPAAARAVGLPGVILHGLYTMAQVARANLAAAGGDPRQLKRLSVEFRAFAVPEREITVSTLSRAPSGDGQVLVRTQAEQDGRRIVRNAEVELAVAGVRPRSTRSGSSNPASPL